MPPTLERLEGKDAQDSGHTALLTLSGQNDPGVLVRAEPEPDGPRWRAWDSVLFSHAGIVHGITTGVNSIHTDIQAP